MFLTKKTQVRKKFKGDSTLFLFVIYSLSLSYIHTGV